MPGKGARDGADMRRAAAVLLLVAVAAIGLRAGGAFSAAANPGILGLSGQVFYWTIAGAEVVIALVGIALLIARLIWGRTGDRPLQRRRQALRWGRSRRSRARGWEKFWRGRGQPARAAQPTGRHTAGTVGGAVGPHPPGTPWPLLVLFAVVALAVVALTTYRRRRTIPRATS